MGQTEVLCALYGNSTQESEEHFVRRKIWNLILHFNALLFEFIYSIDSHLFMVEPD